MDSDTDVSYDIQESDTAVDRTPVYRPLLISDIKQTRLFTPDQSCCSPVFLTSCINNISPQSNGETETWHWRERPSPMLSMSENDSLENTTTWRSAGTPSSNFKGNRVGTCSLSPDVCSRARTRMNRERSNHVQRFRSARSPVLLGQQRGVGLGCPWNFANK